MIVISQNRRSVSKVKDIWIGSEDKEGKCSINATVGYGAEEEFWREVGKYPASRAYQVFEGIIQSVGLKPKIFLPKE